ncbi:unnamed protein product [Prorocentrum cordatum]|uniref:Protochlorophyllide reductase n=1 Tax=Prorocentrum cordatum TaxID=2364126 RepID=A0ABN9XXZ1_9DINO|nr:unnamed protein product [Polarella glacialis]
MAAGTARSRRAPAASRAAAATAAWALCVLGGSAASWAVGALAPPASPGTSIRARRQPPAAAGPPQALRRAAAAVEQLDAPAAPRGEAAASSGPSGKVAIITGASTGVGLATAEGLARSGLYATIILAGRDADKHRRALDGLRGALGPGTGPVDLRHMSLELDSLESVRNFSTEFLKLRLPLHTLILNAGVMALPDRKLTADGFEYQFGVNHLGHFLLANLLLDSLVSSSSWSDPGRLISLSSSAHQMPSPLLQGDLGDLQSERYTAWSAYGQSKLANLLFVYELDRRCRRLGLPLAANAVHPGVVSTELARYIGGGGGGPTTGGLLQGFGEQLSSLLLKTPKDPSAAGRNWSRRERGLGTWHTRKD